MKRTITVRTAALTAVAALGLTCLGLGAAVGEEGNGSSDVPNISSITQTTGSITIHKYTPTTSSNVEGKNNGMKLEDNTLTELGAKPIQGVKFSIKQIKGLDIKTNAGWKQAEKLSELFKTSKTEKTITDFQCTTSIKCTLGEEKVVTTESDGSVKQDKLPVGFYLVQEANAPTDSVIVQGESPTKASSLVGAEPFIISVPLTNPTDHKTWVYDVHAYPKNSTVGITKDVKDSTTPGAGNTNGDKSQIQYVIRTDIPKSVKKLKKYLILDPLDARLKYIENTDKVEVVGADNNAISAATLEKGKDYEIDVKKYDNVTSTTEDPKPATFVSVNFTEQGMTKLLKYRDENAAARVQWTLTTQLTQLKEAKSDIPNHATLIPTVPNNPQNDWNPKQPPEIPPSIPPGNPSPKVISKYGKVVINKTGKDNAKLQGATFKLFTCDKNGDLTNYKTDQALEKSGNSYEESVLNDNAISVDGQNAWTTTSSEGTVSIQGLQLNDFKNNSDEKTGQRSETWKQNHFYCLVETVAPVGYEKLPNPVKFQLTQNDPSYTKTLNIQDVPSNGGFHLPVTGGQGIALLAIAGGLLVAGSVIYTVAAGRKRRQNA